VSTEPPPLTVVISWADIRRLVRPMLRWIAFATFAIIAAVGFVGWCGSFPEVGLTPGRWATEIATREGRHALCFVQWATALAGMILVDIARSVAALARKN
jgi:hypothetical protein